MANTVKALPLFGALVTIPFLILLMPMVASLAGAVAGWAVGLFFEDTIMAFFSAIGADTSNITLWNIGAAMGFMGGFLKTNVVRNTTSS